MNAKLDVQPVDRGDLVRFYEMLPWVAHILKPMPTIELGASFSNILERLNKLRAGKYSEGKQVVRFGSALFGVCKPLA